MTIHTTQFKNRENILNNRYGKNFEKLDKMNKLQEKYNIKNYPRKYVVWLDL